MVILQKSVVEMWNRDLSRFENRKVSYILDIKDLDDQKPSRSFPGPKLNFDEFLIDLSALSALPAAPWRGHCGGAGTHVLLQIFDLSCDFGTRDLYL